MHKPISIILALAMCTQLAQPAFAHTSESQLRATVSATGAFEGGPLLWSIESQARWSDETNGLQQTMVRPALGYRVSDGLDLWAGYARIIIERDENDIDEERFWQQASYDVATFADGALTGRTRLEQRFRSTGDDTGWRVRQQFRFVRPIDGTAVSMVVANETFATLNQTDWGQSQGFDQNRVTLGLQWRANDTMRFEVAYMNQYNNRAPGPDRISHILALNATAQF